MFQIRDVMKNYYIFYDELNTLNYIINILNNNNFINSNIEKINIFTNMIR